MVNMEDRVPTFKAPQRNNLLYANTIFTSPKEKLQGEYCEGNLDFTADCWSGSSFPGLFKL
jgi:hypothetical protein